MIDIHSHILPNIVGDDGSRSEEMTLEMGRQLIESGFSMVFATPHFIHGESYQRYGDIVNISCKINELFEENGISLKVLPAHEISLDQIIGEKLSTGEIGSLGGSKYVLIELPMNDIPMNFESIIFDLKLKGFIPILAHPERNAKIKENPSIVYKYLDMGIFCQLNLRSISGLYGKTTKETARWILNQGYYQFIGSDGHNSSSRSMDVKNELEILKTIISEEYYKDLTINNPFKIVEDKTINVDLRSPTTSVGLFDKIFKQLGGIFNV